MKKTLATLGILAIVFMAAAPAVEAQTIDQSQTIAGLQAQISSLLALVQQLQAKLAQLGGAPATGVPIGTTQFTSNLTIGSTGAEVVRLQQFLISGGFLTVPQGTQLGYFGNLTKAALAKFQASQGISPAVGYFGPITRARVNIIIVNQVNVGGGVIPLPVPIGIGGIGGIGITTPGAEGIMTVTQNNAGLVSTVYEGDNMDPVLGIKISARQSDIAVQRVRINLGTNSTLYNKIFSRLYVTDGNHVLAAENLNSNNIIKDGSNYYAEITGFNFVVPRDSDKTLVIKADVRSSIDSTYRNVSYLIQLADNGVRGIDGAGIDHYSPTSGSSVSRSITVDQSLSDSATLQLSVDPNTPVKQEVIASDGPDNNQLDGLALLSFDLRANRSDVTLTDITVHIAKSGIGGATASSTVYLYDGSTQIDNASVDSSGNATFSNEDYLIPQDATKVLTVKTDIRNADANPAVFVASVSSSGITAENENGDTLASGNVTGSATGYEIEVRNVGSNVSLISKSVTTSGVPQGSGLNNYSTSSMTATFNVRIQAVGSDVVLGTPASTTPAFDANSFAIYRNGVIVGAIVPSAISYSVPSGATTAGLTNAFRIPEGTTVTIPVTVQLLGRDGGGNPLQSGLYGIGLEQINWTANGTQQTINFMAGDPNWKTNDVSFP